MTTCTPINRECPDDPNAPQPPKTYAPFTACVGSGSLNYDGTGLTFSPDPLRPADGTYTSVTLRGGCIVGAGQSPVAGYTPSECCGPPGASTPVNSTPGTAPVVDTNNANLLTTSAAGLMASLHVIAENGVSVTGLGTQSSPLNISLTGAAASAATGGQGIDARSPTGTVSVQGDGTTTHPLQIDLQPVGTPGVYNGMTVDKYGRFTGYADSGPAGNVKAIVAGQGIQVSPDSAGVYTISLAGAATSGTSAGGGQVYCPPSPDGRIGAAVVTYNAAGVITKIEPYIDTSTGN